MGRGKEKQPGGILLKFAAGIGRYFRFVADFACWESAKSKSRAYVDVPLPSCTARRSIAARSSVVKRT